MTNQQSSSISPQSISGYYSNITQNGKIGELDALPLEYKLHNWKSWRQFHVLQSIDEISLRFWL